VVGSFLLNLLWKWRDGGEEGNDQVLTATSRALQGYRDELLSRRVVPAGEIAQMRRTMQLVARGRAIERKRLAMLAGEESAAEEGAEGEAPCVSWRGCSHVYNNQTMNTTQSYYDRYDRYRRFRTRITQTRILNGLLQHQHPASTRGDSTSTLLPPTHEKMARTSARGTNVTMLFSPVNLLHHNDESKQHLHFSARLQPASENKQKLKTSLPPFPSSDSPTRGTPRPLLSGSVPNTQAEIFLPTLARRR
jgi:hypothetical protein